MTGKRPMIVGIAWYGAEDWEEIRRISVDGDKLEDTHDAWMRSAELQREQMGRAGYYVHKIVIVPKKWAAWSRRNGIPLNGASRAQYVAERVRLTARHLEESK